MRLFPTLVPHILGCRFFCVVNDLARKSLLSQNFGSQVESKVTL